MVFAIKDCEQKVIEIDPLDAMEAILQYVEIKMKTTLPRSSTMNINFNQHTQKIIISVTTDIPDIKTTLTEVH